ncbi:MAG: CAP domain-containing protein [Pyrinomonadaceae bacterium]
MARLITGSEDVTKYSEARKVTISIGGASEEANAYSVAGSPTFEEATETERRAFEVTNKMRVKNGLTQLSWDPVLCRMARRHSEDMARLGFFSHLTPEGLRLRDRARAVGIERYRVLGENIAYNQGHDDPGAFAVERWMVSSGHRANILSREFRGAAIGSFVGADGTVYLSQIFILR